MKKNKKSLCFADHSFPIHGFRFFPSLSALASVHIVSNSARSPLGGYRMRAPTGTEPLDLDSLLRFLFSLRFLSP
ncbi:hypothetical protein ACFX1X_041062 [Malus domestica]